MRSDSMVTRHRKKRETTTRCSTLTDPAADHGEGTTLLERNNGSNVVPFKLSNNNHRHRNRNDAERWRNPGLWLKRCTCG